jgi:hypothetical protein
MSSVDHIMIILQGGEKGSRLLTSGTEGAENALHWQREASARPPASVDDRPVLTTQPCVPNPSLPGLGSRSGSATAPSPIAAKEAGAAGLRSNKSYCP